MATPYHMLLDKQQTIGDVYRNTGLPASQPRKVGETTSPIILLHHDNALPHAARQTANYLETLSIEILAYLPHSPKSWEKRPRNKILLHHGNALPHAARQTANYLGTLSIEMLAYLPHSPKSWEKRPRRFSFIMQRLTTCC
ncbi:hypothetical protein EVAR_103084_1 [Eumeta japonica]|uniref:Mariner Mos1 transposase n=1 Tax=Eumeta variegata TaxID=151549 RepID=A0A4C1WQN7_EUMVA|nr:hypothetical protein EVAR_103084_1 [Eumeta japonica]